MLLYKLSSLFESQLKTKKQLKMKLVFLNLILATFMIVALAAPQDSTTQDVPNSSSGSQGGPNGHGNNQHGQDGPNGHGQGGSGNRQHGPNPQGGSPGSQGLSQFTHLM